MPDPLKVLLARLKLDTTDFERTIKKVRAEAKESNAEARRDAAALTAEAVKQNAILNKTLDTHKRLQAESRTQLGLDQAKAQWEKSQQEHINTKIRTKILETAEIKKQALEEQKLNVAEKQRLVLEKEHLRIAEREANLFNVGTLKAKVKFEPFKAPTLGMQPQDQLAYIGGEKARLAILDKQVLALELQGKFRKVDAEYVRSLIAAERALAEAAEVGVKRELTRLKTLEQEAIAAAKVANPEAMARLKAGIGFAAFTPAAQGTTLAQQEAALVKERQRLNTMEAQLRVLSTEENVRKVDVIAIEKEIAAEKAKLVLEETLLKTRKESAIAFDKEKLAQERYAAKQERIQQKTVDQTAVSNIQQAIGFRPANVPVAQPGILGKIFGPSAEETMRVVTEERAHLAVMQAELKVLADQEAYRKIDIQQVERDIVAEKHKLDLLEKQTVQHRMQAGGPGGPGGPPREREGRGGLLRETVGKLTGGGLFGQIAGGMFAGFVGASIFTGVIDKVHELGKALIEASGPAEQLREQFERLAEAGGKDPVKLLNELRVSTRGLVTDIDLFKISNNLLRQGLKVTDERMTHLVSNTVELARGMNQSSTQVAHALELAFLNPQRGMMRLAHVTGIQVGALRRAMAGLPQSVDASTRATIMFNAVLREEDKMLLRVGKPMTTLPELLQQVSNVEKNFLEGIAQGITHTGTFAEAIDSLSKRLIAFMPRLDEIAQNIGAKLGAAIQWTTDHLHEIKLAFEGIIGLKIASTLINLTGGFTLWGNAVGFVAKQLGLLQLAEEGVAALGLKAGGAGLIGGVAGVAEAAPVAGVVAAGAGLQLAALHEQGVTLKQTKSAFVELKAETKESITILGAVASASVSAAKTAITAWTTSFGPGWAELWSKVQLHATSAWEGILATVLKVYDTVIENTPFGVIAKQIKELADAAETRRLKERPAGLDAVRGVKTGTKFVPTPAPPKKTAEELAATIAEQKKLAQQRMQIQELFDKIAFDRTKQRLVSEQQLIQQQYDEGLISLRQFVSKEIALKDEEYAASVKRINADAAAKKKGLEGKSEATVEGLTVPLITAADKANAEKIIDEKAKDELVLAATKHSTEINTVKKQQLHDEQAAYSAYTEGLIRINKQGVEIRTVDLEQEFKQGTVSAESYIAQRKNLIEEETELTIQGLNLRKEAAKNNEVETAKINSEIIEAQMNRERELTKFTMSEDSVRLESIQNRFEQANKFLQIQQAIAKGTRGPDTQFREVSIIQTQIELTTQHLAKLEKLQKTLQETGKAGTEDWIKTTEQIAQATEEEQKLNLQLAQAQDLAAPLSGLFGQLAGMFEKFGGPASRGIAQLLQGMQSSFDSLSKFSISLSQYGGAGGLFGSIATSFKSLFQPNKTETVTGRQTAQQMFDSGLTKSATSMDVLADTIAKLTAEMEGLRAAAKAKPSYQEGTDYVPQTGPAILHKGEAVLTAAQNKVNALNAPAQAPPTGTAMVVSAMNILGLGKYVPPSVMTGPGGAVNYLARIPQPYQSTATFINNLDPGFIQDLVSAMGTKAGSPQRSNITADISQYSQDLSTSGYDYKAFSQWIQSGSPSYQFGTMGVPKTGLALLHQNESVFPPGLMQQFVNSIKAATDAVVQLALKFQSFPVPKVAVAGGIPAVVGGVPAAPDATVTASMPAGPEAAGPEASLGGALSAGSIDEEMKALPLTRTSEVVDKFNKKLEDSIKIPFAEKLQGFVGGLSTAIQGVMGVVQGLTAGKTGGGGALSGAMSLGGFGAQIGMMAGPMGAAIGGGVGAVLGGITGGIFGAKEKHLQQDLHKITDQMQSILDSMHEGAISLSQAIQDLRKERQAAIQILSQDPKGGKGGGKGGKKGFQPSQAQSIIDQIDAQIGQLVNEQQQLLSQLDQQVAILANPLPFQQYVQSLDQIIQKYQEFASAAQGNAQAVANAQLYLNESLQAYVQTLSQQLNQAQQQAIQDALTLLNLEYQRQQIINQEAQQEYDILTQGVLTRQRTTAMTKGQEIGQLRYQRDMQLQQLDEQIALQQYKVQSEQKIFNMATTRIGLEMELLALQEEQANTQNGQTAALLQVVQQLQAAMQSGSLMNAIGGLGGTGTGTGLLTTILGTLGLGGNIPQGVLTGTGGATNYLSQIPQPYQSITNYINNLDPNFLMNLWSAMQTPPGSAERQGALIEAQPYAADANTSGYDFNSFAQWIQQGAAIQGTTATVNNIPAPTGPAQLPRGIAFQQPTGTGYASGTIPSYTPTGQTPYDSVTQSMSDLSTSTMTVTQAMQNLGDVTQGIVDGYQKAQQQSGGRIERYQAGGYVATTGPAIVDAGEYVLPKPVVGMLNAVGGVKNFIAGLSASTSPVSTATPASSDSSRAQVESSLLNMTSQRVNMEMTVVSARQDLIQAEMQHLAALNDTMTRIASMPTSGPAGSLESMINQVYETRGRYGSGNFRREYL